jgi:tetratricopeptide (TPR) repeat protein
VKPTPTKILLICGTFLLTVLLYFAPKTTQGRNESRDHMPKVPRAVSSNIEVFVKMAEKVIAPTTKTSYDRWTRADQHDSLTGYWEKVRRPDIAAWFAEADADKNKADAAKWLLAGKKYYNAVQFCRDNSEIPMLYISAMRCLDRSLALQPLSSEAKIALASCYVEGGEDPMKGIGMLREVEQRDSNNLQLQIAFALFSVKSGQHDKAVARFDKALRIDSNYIEAYLHLAGIYEQQGEIGKCTQMLEKYADKTDDITARTEVKKYIQELNNNKH